MGPKCSITRCKRKATIPIRYTAFGPVYWYCRYHGKPIVEQP